jgi:long-chain acyl-CoA synthetase
VPDSELQARRATLTTASLATIIYTSGTTGRPKGCELSHGNLLGTGRSAGAVLPELFHPGGSTLLFLPLAHVFARLIQVACVETGARMGHTADIKNLLADFATFQPSFILSVPRVFEKVYNTAKQKAHADGKGPIFDRAEAVAIRYSEALEKGAPGAALSLQHKLFDKLVYSKLRAAMGGKVAWAVSGGAPLGPRLGHFFRGIGVTILEGYGLTETTAPATVNRPSKFKIGTVGPAVPGVAVRIAPDGEVEIRGLNVFREYWRNPEATEATFDDGWLRTGDIGSLDSDGYLSITGRKKELIVTAGGKNVAPAELEDPIRAHPLVSQVVVVGDGRPFIAALLTLDADMLPTWLENHGLDKSLSVADAAQLPGIREELQRAIDTANTRVSRAEGVRAFEILPDDFTEAGGQLTPKLSVKRHVVLEQCAERIDRLYADAKAKHGATSAH